jgi:DNA-binding MarR family transcriptional regulator
MLLQTLEEFHAWRTARLRVLETAPGIETFVWLLKNEGKPVAVSRLYRDSRYSEPTVRKCLHAFLAEGYVVLEFDSCDTRRHVLRGTPKLNSLASEYVAWVERLARAPLREDDLPTSDGC